MAINSGISVGNLDRLRGSVVVSDYPELNVTAEYLTQAGISIAYEGNVTDFINVMTGRVTSQVPYLPVTITIPLNRAQSLAASWWAKAQTNSLLGLITITPDSTTYPNITVQNCAITTVPGQTYNGSDPTYTVTISGYVIVNSELWQTS